MTVIVNYPQAKNKADEFHAKLQLIQRAYMIYSSEVLPTYSDRL